MPKPAASGFVGVSAKSAYVAPASTLGFSSLVEPDDAFDSLKFKANVHFGEDQEERLIAGIQEHVIDALWPKFLKEAESKGKDPTKLKKPDARAWVEDHLKEPKEGARIELPYVIFSNSAEYRDKETGQMVRKTMRAYDARGQLLDLPALKLGMGSIVQAVLIPGIFMSPLIKSPQPSFKLQGVRVLKLVQWGGSSSVGEVSDDDIAGLDGMDLDLDGLAQFAQSVKPKDRAAPAASFADDLDDEIPF